MSGLPGIFTRYVEHEPLQPTAPYDAFIAVIERDAKHSQAAIQLVLAQPAISSQLIDNLNASIHLRALLTDLFLIDEVFKSEDRNRRGVPTICAETAERANPLSLRVQHEFCVKRRLWTVTSLSGEQPDLPPVCQNSTFCFP